MENPANKITDDKWMAASIALFGLIGVFIIISLILLAISTAIFL